MPENILVVPSSVVAELGITHGFTQRSADVLESLLHHDGARFLPREDGLEQNEDWKQLIPYMILTHQDAAANVPLRLFAYRRTPKGGEPRLHQQRSIGIGGHINDQDGSDPHDAFMRGARRELYEEVSLPQTSSVHFMPMAWAGLLNDDTTPVGRTHLGLVFQVVLDTPEVVSKATEHADDGLLTPEELRADLSSLEAWSQMLLQSMF